MIPGWDPESADVEVLKGGLTNRVYRVCDGDRDCVLRLSPTDADAFGLDRSNELPILEQAGRAGIAPRVLYANRPAGIVLTEFLPGRVWADADMQDIGQLETLAELLRSVHALPVCNFRINLSVMARNYCDYLQRRQGLHAFASICVEIIDGIPVREELACCHNDIVAANVVDDGVLKLIDWEYACDNDPMFDLASAIGYHNLDDHKAATLLRAYAGGAGAELEERLREQIRAYDAIQWLWLATRHLVSPSQEQAKRLEELQQRIR